MSRHLEILPLRGSNWLVIAAAALSLAAAADPAERLSDPAQEARARAIFADVRCLVCQNESIDDSEAPLAHDLRQIVREQVRAGHSDAEIKRFLTDRYGEFVLLTPAFSLTNLALWGGPFLVVVLGAGLLLARLRNRLTEEELSPEEAERVRRLSETDSA
jgi:cytochrome c-type biogenesis protein CcmH